MAKSPTPKSRRAAKHEKLPAKKTLRWIDAFDRHVALRGLAWLKETRKTKSFRRLPDRAAKPLSVDVQELSRNPAGAFLSFYSNSTNISVRMKVASLEQMDHMPATGMSGAEIFFRESEAWHPITVARPSLTDTSFECSLLANAPKRRREFRIYLPLYKTLESLSLGLDPGSQIEPAPAPKGTKPIFFYGTSITQGGCASTAGSDYVSILGRRLEAEVINFGFSGSGKGEPEVARLIREIDAEMFVLDFLANAEVETLEEKLAEFIRLLRQKHRHTPIVLMSCPVSNQTLLDAGLRGKLDRKRDIAMRTYLERKSAGDRNIYFLDGNGILPPGLVGTYVDGVHPTSHGFAIMAERLEPQLRALRLALKKE